MKNVYQILLIDDEENDINLIKTELSKLDIQVRIDVIQKEEQLIDRLEHNLPDLIISGYHIPTLSGINALQIVQDRQPQMPFIMVAGSIGEEKAINVLLQGASYYATKQNLDLLGPAILREHANYKEHNKKSRRLDRAHTQYENLVQSVNGILWEADAKTFEFLYVSPQSKQLLGFSPDEWLSEPNFWQQHIHPDDRKEAVQYCHHITQQGENHEFDYRMLDADGKVVWLRDYVTVITVNGEPNRLRGFMVDISREKKAERQRDKAFELADIGHWELDLINEKLYWSNTVKKLHEVDPGYEPTLDTALDFYKEGDHRQKITAALENAIETGKSFEVELQIITSNGNEKWVRAVGETELHNGKCIRIYGSTQDISKRKVSEKKYRDIFNLSPLPMWMYDPKTLKFLDVNRAAMNHYGFSYKEFMNMTLKDIRPVEDIPDLMEAVKEIRRKIDSYYEGQFRHKTKDESIIHVNIKRNTIDYEGRKADMVVAEDITEKLEAERELQLSEQKFKSLVRSGASMIALLNDEGDYTFASENHKQIVGWSQQELIGKNAFSLIHPDDIKRVKSVFNKLKAEKTKQHTSPFRFKHKEGHWIWQESIGSDLSENTILDGYVINSHDITDRRYYIALEKIERDVLEESITGNSSLTVLAEKLLLKLEDLHSGMICSIQRTVDGRLHNLAAPSLSSEYLAEIEGLPIGNNICSCGTAAYLKEPVIVENINEDSRWEGYRHLGEVYDFKACWSKPIIDSNQNVVATFATYYKKPQAPSEREKNTIDRVAHLLRLLFDSFEKEKAEQELRELYQKNRLVLESTDEGLYGIDVEGCCTFINKAAANKLGYHAEECIGKNMHQLIHHHQPNGDRFPQSECPINISKNKHESCRVMDEVFWRADGTCFNVDYTSNPMIEEGEVKGAVVAFSDITVRKQHEKELQESLDEKETLLMEIHHRVKNNLAIISGLITLQALEVEDENFRNMLENTTSRIHSIAMVHELLYQSENFTEIPFEKYIKALLSTIKKTIGPDKKNIDLITKVNVGGLNINQAIPLGLMLNELMTNSLKHAFTNREKGEIMVSINRSDNNIKVIYEDNGDGFPDHIDFADTDSLGNTLIHTLLKQLSKDYEAETKGKFKLKFQFAERNKGAHSNYSG